MVEARSQIGGPPRSVPPLVGVVQNEPVLLRFAGLAVRRGPASAAIRRSALLIWRKLLDADELLFPVNSRTRSTVFVRRPVVDHIHVHTLRGEVAQGVRDDVGFVVSGGNESHDPKIMWRSSGACERCLKTRPSAAVPGPAHLVVPSR